MLHTERLMNMIRLTCAVALATTLLAATTASAQTFEVAAVILTIAVIAAVMLTPRRRPGAKHQDPSLQAAVRARDRVRLVKVPTERPPVEPAPATDTEGKA